MATSNQQKRRTTAPKVRRFERLQQKVKAKLQGYGDCEVVNISAGGMLVKIPQTIPVGTRVQCLLESNALSSALELPGVIVRSNSATETAVEFVSMNLQHTADLRKIVYGQTTQSQTKLRPPSVATKTIIRRNDLPSGVTVVEILGSVDDTSDLANAIGKPSASRVEINVGGMKRITSAGIRAWVSYFTNLKSQGVNFTFVDCSPSVVYTAGIIKGFLCGAQASTIALPFMCTSCGEEVDQAYSTEEVISPGFKVEDQVCPSCGGKATFDEVPSEYFGHIRKLRNDGQV